jgi:two-component SAPR family response regulator
VPSAADPPIQVLCFGSARVLCANQLVWPRQPTGDAKPWELLLYLACQPAEGVARDRIVAALWPDDDLEADAPHRFRQLRYRLRGVLSTVPGAPATDGITIGRGGPLRLDPAIIYSDAQEFLQLLRTARLTPEPLASIRCLERARALYTGDLFDGPDLRRYAWASERDESGVTLREHFRRLFQNATLTLAGLYLETDQLAAAADTYHEAAALDPSDERIWRALFRIHARCGDRTALLREERRMRTVLHDLAGDAEADAGTTIEPSRELVLEFQRLLAGLDASSRQATAV